MKKDISFFSGSRVKPLANNEVPTREDLRDVLKFCDLLETAIVLITASGGLIANEIINLKVHNFKKGFDPQTEITKLNLHRKTVGVYTTFLTPQASRAVINYLKYRDHQQAQRVLSDDGYLFIRRRIPSEYADTSDEELRKMNEETLSMIYRRIAEKV